MLTDFDITIKYYNNYFRGEALRKIKDAASEIPLPGFEQFQTDFLLSRKAEIVILVEALQALDYRVLYEHAHNWRGFSDAYGFQELAVMASKLEEFALSKNAQSCEEILKQVTDYLGNDD